MVILNVKRGTENQFLFETTTSSSISSVIKEIVSIYNGRLKIRRVCMEIEALANHGPMLPPDIIGLTDEQIAELKLFDAWADKSVPMDGWTYNRDPVGRRNGRQPKPAMQEVLKRATDEAENMISKKLVDSNKALTLKQVQEALGILRGAVTIVYPMQLPPHDVIQKEFTNTEDLSETHSSLEVIEPTKAQLWFAGRQMLDEKRLTDYIGRIEKCKAIVKLTKTGEGPPGMEPVISEEARKQLMLLQYRRQEELKRLDEDDDDQYLSSKWADNRVLQKDLNGIKDVRFRCGM